MLWLFNKKTLGLMAFKQKSSQELIRNMFGVIPVPGVVDANRIMMLGMVLSVDFHRNVFSRKI